MHVAAKHGFVDVVRILIEEGGAAVNIPAISGLGYTPLHLAAQCGHVSVVCLLLEKGATLDNDLANGAQTPLHVACKHGQTVVVKELVGRGADISKRTKRKQNSLDIAKEQNHLHLIPILQKPMIAFLCGHHSRCGAGSVLSLLPHYLLEDVTKLAFT